ncbi:MAG: histidine kinase [Hyphomicrobiaceae bacterium]
MPSLFRFLAVLGVVVGVLYGSLFAASLFLEPELREISKPVYGVRIRTQ